MDSIDDVQRNGTGNDDVDSSRWCHFAMALVGNRFLD